MFTLDTESGFRDVVFVTAAWGLGETVVGGTVNPDEFYVFKPTLEAGHDAVLSQNMGSKLVFISECFRRSLLKQARWQPMLRSSIRSSGNDGSCYTTICTT